MERLFAIFAAFQADDLPQFGGYFHLQLNSSPGVLLPKGLLGNVHGELVLRCQVLLHPLSLEVKA